MKKIAATIAGVFIALNSFGQLKPDSALAAYAKSNGYVQITDSLHLPQTIRPYYGNTTRFLSIIKSDRQEMYVWLEYVQDNPTLLKVPLVDISTIAYQKNNDEQNAILQAHPDTMMLKGKKTVVYKMAVGMFGNVSGHDGDLWIDKDTRKVKFLMGQ